MTFDLLIAYKAFNSVYLDPDKHLNTAILPCKTPHKKSPGSLFEKQGFR